MAGNSKELTGWGLGSRETNGLEAARRSKKEPIQSPESGVPSAGCKTRKECKRNNLLGSQPGFQQGKKDKQVLGDDTGECMYTDDGPWVPEDTIDRFGDGGQGWSEIQAFYDISRAFGNIDL